MGKSDDSISRRKNRKKARKLESKSKVTTRVASIIAAKKRRLTGKRRLCQGMCFSLPTPEDPFNDRHGKPDEPFKKRKKDSQKDKKFKDRQVARLKKGQENGVESSENENFAFVSSFSFMGPEIVVNPGEPECKIIKRQGSTCSVEKRDSLTTSGDCPSKFLMMCLNYIQDNMQHDEDLESASHKPLFASRWGLEFWDCYTDRKDILESGGAESAVEKIAWIASTAADTISLKEKEGLSFSGPFLLYLVPSQEKAHEVRQVCKALKPTGIHTVSLHSGASIDHQIKGLKSCEPEFIISTPDRLLELIALKAVDISGISLLVIDGLEAPFKGSYFDSVKTIRELITGDLRTVVFCDFLNSRSNSIVKTLVAKEESTLK